MITIQLTGSDKQEILKAQLVIEQLFEGVQVEIEKGIDNDTKLHIQMSADKLPGNDGLFALLKTAVWKSAQAEIWKLYSKPIISRDELKQLKESIEAASQLAGEFEELQYKIEAEASEAYKELERIESIAVGYILDPNYPALEKSE